MRSQRVQDDAAPQCMRKPCKQVYCVFVFDNGVLWQRYAVMKKA